MLDLLSKELFIDPTTTFLDPCCRSGVFLSEIFIVDVYFCFIYTF